MNEVPDKEMLALYRRAPRAAHAEHLREWVKELRRQAGGDDVVIVAVRPYRAWRVARLIRGEEQDIQFIDDQVFDDIEDAEWAIFRRCWQAARGVDPGERVAQSHGGN